MQSSPIDDENISEETLPINPIGISTGKIISHVKRALSISIPTINIASLQSNHPILAYGLDSVSGQQFLCELEKIFFIPGSDSSVHSSTSSSNQVYSLISMLLSERDATIFTVTRTLCRGYIQNYRPIMYDGWKLLEEAKQRETKTRGKASGILSNDILSKCMLKADIDSLAFPDSSGLRNVSLSTTEEALYIILYFFFLISVLSPIILLGVLYTFYNIQITTILTVIISTTLYYLPVDCYPPAFRTSAFYILANKYYSHRVILEAPISTEVPSIYTFGPHGIFALPPALQTLFHEYFTGQNFHVLAADVVFKIPLYNIAAKVSWLLFIVDLT